MTEFSKRVVVIGLYVAQFHQKDGKHESQWFSSINNTINEAEAILKKIGGPFQYGINSIVLKPAHHGRPLLGRHGQDILGKHDKRRWDKIHIETCPQSICTFSSLNYKKEYTETI